VHDPIPAPVALETTYLNNVRFYLRRGDAGLAFSTDSTTGDGPGGLIVIDLASRRSWRKLHDHSSVRPVQGHLAIIEGRLVPGLAMASDGIAIAHDGTPLLLPAGRRRLSSVTVDAFADEQASDDDVAKTVQDHGEKGASDGLERRRQGGAPTEQAGNRSVPHLPIGVATKCSPRLAENPENEKSPDERGFR
jgi:sugar lactone lactonase YvrE